MGKWVSGAPGNGAWLSNRKAVNAITGNKPVQFVNGRPNFSPWSKGTIPFKPGKLKGTHKEFDLVYDFIKKQKGLASRNAAKNYLRKAKLTPHHLDNKTIQLIPSPLHGKIPHIGSASDLRGGF
ncbi:HNH endonuclease [Lignipirellula cremea]|uniref:HNH endonuclease n=1 Tax=Lignipirellula cremea TaxID=2528010 RepID=UPI0011AA1564